MSMRKDRNSNCNSNYVPDIDQLCQDSQDSHRGASKRRRQPPAPRRQQRQAMLTPEELCLVRELEELNTRPAECNKKMIWTSQNGARVRDIGEGIARVASLLQGGAQQAEREAQAQRGSEAEEQRRAQAQRVAKAQRGSEAEEQRRAQAQRVAKAQRGSEAEEQRRAQAEREAEARHAAQERLRREARNAEIAEAERKRRAAPVRDDINDLRSALDPADLLLAAQIDRFGDRSRAPNETNLEYLRRLAAVTAERRRMHDDNMLEHQVRLLIEVPANTKLQRGHWTTAYNLLNNLAVQLGANSLLTMA